MLFPVCRYEKKNRFSYRVFDLEEDAQKTFTALYSGKGGALPKADGNIFTFSCNIEVFYISQKEQTMSRLTIEITDQQHKSIKALKHWQPCRVKALRNMPCSVCCR